MFQSAKNRPRGVAARFALVAAMGLCVLCLSPPAPAAVVTSGDVQPADPTTWTSDTTAYVGNTAAGTLSITEGSGISVLYSYLGWDSGSMGDVTVNGVGSTWINSSILIVGVHGRGTLTITDGGSVSNNGCYVGHVPGSMGDVIVDGEGSTWVNSTELNVGNYGSSTLSITGGGSVTSNYSYIGTGADSTGQVVVNGASSTLTGSSYLYIGFRGRGTLSIIKGGSVTSSYRSSIGEISGSTGEVIVDGVGSTWTNRFLYVGYNGSGTLNVTGGGKVSNSYCSVGEFSTGIITVDGTNSTLTIISSLDVGRSDSGTLNVTNGGSVTSKYGDIGNSYGSGTVTVDGTNSTWTNSSSLYVGIIGTGTLNITNGGALNNSSEGYLGYSSGSTGAVTVDGAGSTWTNSSYLDVGRSGTGTLSITEGGLVSVAGTLTIDYDGDGDFFVNMATGGMLALKGDADDSLAAFLGLVSGTDAIRYWDDLTAGWAALTAATYGEDYTLGYLTTGTLTGYTILTVGTVTPPLTAGDANQDGKVNDLDASILAANWQRAGDATWATGDFNGDGDVNDLDASILAANWQYGVGAAVPEPALFVLLLGGLAIAAMRRVTR